MRTLNASRRRHRKLSGSKCSRNLPSVGYASRHRHRRLFDSMCSRSLPPVGYASRRRRYRLSGSRYSHSLPSVGYASNSRRRRLFDSKCSHSLPSVGYASNSHRHRLSGNRYSHNHPRVYVVSKPQIRHCLLSVSPSNYNYFDMEVKRPTRSSKRCWSCYGEAKEREQEDCGLAVHFGLMECSNVEVFQENCFKRYSLMRVFGA